MHLTEGESVVLEIVRVASHGRITDVGKLALIFKSTEIKQLSWDCRVDHKVAMEGSTVVSKSEQARSGTHVRTS